VRISLLGTRGIPANYWRASRRFAEELSSRLVARGHQVTVYCRERYPETHYRGARLQLSSTIRHKYLDTLAHTAILDSSPQSFHRADVALYCKRRERHRSTILPRILGIPVALNVDGMSVKRKKWNRLAKAW